MDVDGEPGMGLTVRSDSLGKHTVISASPQPILFSLKPESPTGNGRPGTPPGYAHCAAVHAFSTAGKR